jgi:hypothetical protein
MKKVVGSLLVSAILMAPLSFAKGSHASGGHSGHTSIHSSVHHSKSYCHSCTHDSHGKIKRSSHAKTEFRNTHPCPSTGKTTGPCKGYVTDHVQSLKHGGADSPDNMQWQTIEAAKAKDRVE